MKQRWNVSKERFTVAASSPHWWNWFHASSFVAYDHCKSWLGMHIQHQQGHHQELQRSQLSQVYQDNRGHWNRWHNWETRWWACSWSAPICIMAHGLICGLKTSWMLVEIVMPDRFPDDYSMLISGLVKKQSNIDSTNHQFSRRIIKEGCFIGWLVTCVCHGMVDKGTLQQVMKQSAEFHSQAKCDLNHLCISFVLCIS